MVTLLAVVSLCQPVFPHQLALQKVAWASPTDTPPSQPARTPLTIRMAWEKNLLPIGGGAIATPLDVVPPTAPERQRPIELWWVPVPNRPPRPITVAALFGTPGDNPPGLIGTITVWADDPPWQPKQLMAPIPTVAAFQPLGVSHALELRAWESVTYMVPRAPLIGGFQLAPVAVRILIPSGPGRNHIPAGGSRTHVPAAP